ncbi:MAG TPA: methyltransferase domain-containing protein [Candidatus Nocardiopsis merdipullorum]|nr:methyltransferase domain-containing protein [Candidatus Nocardiopsis merdipullorum]
MSHGLGLEKLADPSGEQRGVNKRIGAIAQHLPPYGDRLLDVGCGEGVHTMRIVEGYVRVDAIDTETARLEVFAERLSGTEYEGRVRVHKMSANSLTFDSHTFDRITAFDKIEHLEELEESLSEIHRVLKPGGAFSLTTSNRWFPFETHGVLWGDRHRSALSAPFLPWVRPLHERMSATRSFTTQEMGRLLRGSGLRVRAIDYLMPTFDRGPQSLRTLSDALEDTPLRVFGPAMAVTAVKPKL